MRSTFSILINSAQYQCKCSYVIYVTAAALALLFLPTYVHYGMLTGCLPVVAVITNLPASTLDWRTDGCCAHTHLCTHTGLIVPAVAPLPHYLYNCTSETFSSAAKPSLHKGDKHPSHDNSPLGRWFGKDVDPVVMFRGYTVRILTWNQVCSG